MGDVLAIVEERLVGLRAGRRRAGLQCTVSHGLDRGLNLVVALADPCRVGERVFARAAAVVRGGGIGDRHHHVGRFHGHASLGLADAQRHAHAHVQTASGDHLRERLEAAWGRTSAVVEWGRVEALDGGRQEEHRDEEHRDMRSESAEDGHLHVRGQGLRANRMGVVYFPVRDCGCETVWI